MKSFKTGFTLVELLIVVVVMAILAAIVVVGYTPAQLRTAKAVTQTELEKARSKLEFFNGTERDYPPNLANIDYSAPEKVAMTLYTNVPTMRQYKSLTPDQNAQLFLNTCNAFMPIEDATKTYFTSCSFSGKNIHAKGQVSSNIVFHGPEVTEAEVDMTNSKCGAICDTVELDIKNNFIAQGGSWPISVPNKQVSMPEFDVIPTGKATKYCLEARFVDYNDVVTHILSGESEFHDGYCPDDPELGYPAVN